MGNRDDCEIEHFFSDSVIEGFHAAGDRLYGSSVFQISDSGKARIAEGVSALDTSDFANFRSLFADIVGALKIPEADK